MAKAPNKTKLRNFRHKIDEILAQELELRAQVKRLYEQLVLDAKDDTLALRHVRLAYFQAQKNRLHKLLEERLEFHPFFGAHFQSSIHYEESDEEEDDEDPLI